MAEQQCKSRSATPGLKGFELMKKAILDDFPRLGLEDTFRFACHDGLACFNVCCADVNIMLTPYDVLRMRTRLGLPSGEFLRRYTLAPRPQGMPLPVVLLKMKDDGKKTCPFVAGSGCTIYEDRPWPCRMYPVGMASSKDGKDGKEEEFYFLMREAPCDGLEEAKEWTVAGWMENQGVGPYNEMGDAFARLTLHPRLLQGQGLAPSRIEMFYMACYDQDKFRKFLFESTFFKRFDVNEERRETLATSDLELLKFAFLWLRFSLFGDKVEGIDLLEEAYTGTTADERKTL
jgi:Fe-S-cluster containining protein